MPCLCLQSPPFTLLLVLLPVSLQTGTEAPSFARDAMHTQLSTIHDTLELLESAVFQMTWMLFGVAQHVFALDPQTAQNIFLTKVVSGPLLKLVQAHREFYLD